MKESIYKNGTYLEKNPTWHAEDAPWKATQIMRMIDRNRIHPNTICEVGCGTGEILAQLQSHMASDCEFYGYDISQQAFQLSQNRSSERLHFFLGDFVEEQTTYFDLILLIDVIEHIDNHYTFLRHIQSKSKYKIFHIPLDLSIVNILRPNKLNMLAENVGHIHYFTKNTALRALEATGYRVIDWFYTSGFRFPAKTMRSRVAKVPRKCLFLISKDLTARVFGGVSLMVLAE